MVKVNGEDQIESFLRKWGPNWDNEKLEDHNEISWQIRDQKSKLTHNLKGNLNGFYRL